MLDLSPFMHWLSNTPLSLAIKTISWVIPITQSIHILSIGVVIASIAMFDLRLAGFIGREQSLREAAERFLPWVWGALAVLLCTGIILIIGEPTRELSNTLFWTKMGLLVLAVAVTLSMRSMLEDTNFRSLPTGKRTIVRICAIASLLCFIGIVICGRWIAYTDYTQ